MCEKVVETQSTKRQLTKALWPNRFILIPQFMKRDSGCGTPIHQQEIKFGSNICCSVDEMLMLSLTSQADEIVAKTVRGGNALN